MGQRRQDIMVVVGSFLVAGLIAGHYYFQSDEDDGGPLLVNHWLHDTDTVDRKTLIPEAAVYEADLDDELWARTILDIRKVSETLNELLERKEYRTVGEELLQIAAQAVEAGDHKKLGGVMSLLGQLSIEEQDFDAAEVYLKESLEIYELAENTVGAAQVQMHLGRMHLKLRQRARTAGQAYDRILLARWQIAHGHYDAAQHNLDLVIDENLSINRFGAAASAYNSLSRLHAENGDTYYAEEAAMEAARLYAASGQLGNANTTLANLEARGVEAWRLAEIEQEIELRHEEFRANVEQVQRAEDYNRLYNSYRSRGDELSAWRLRLQASESLSKVSKREMYHRIPDVLALLYVSNGDRDRASDYFEQARETFDLEGQDELLSQTRKLEGDVL